MPGRQNILHPRESLTQPQAGTVAEVAANQITGGAMRNSGGQWRFEFNTDPTILARVTNGTTTKFSVDASGNVVARTITIDPASSSLAALTITNSQATSADLLRVENSSSAAVLHIVNSGAIQATGGAVLSGLSIYTGNEVGVSDKPVAALVTGGLEFGPGGTTATDIKLYRSAANVLKTDDQFIAADGLTGKYVSAAGRVTGADADFTVAPGDGTVYVVRNSTDGKVYLTARANGAWKAIEVL